MTESQMSSSKMRRDRSMLSKIPDSLLTSTKSKKNGNDNVSNQILKRQIDYRFKSQNGQAYSRLTKMQKLVKNIFVKYPHQNVVFSVYPVAGQLEPKSVTEVEIYCFGKAKKEIKDTLVIGKNIVFYC